jgi:hypothetical protein
MAELSTTAETTANTCCAPEQQAPCCEPSAKAECCDPKLGRRRRRALARAQRAMDDY